MDYRICRHCGHTIHRKNGMRFWRDDSAMSHFAATCLASGRSHEPEDLTSLREIERSLR